MNTFARLVLASAMLALAATAAAHGGGTVTPAAAIPGPPKPVVTPPTVTPPTARELTLTMLDLTSQYGTATPGAKGQLLASLIAAAKDRYDELSALVATDPAELLLVALPPDVLASLPPQAIPFLERPADETGTLEVYHVDHFNPAEDHYLHFLNTKTERLALHFAGKAPDLATGAEVRVRGVRLDNAIVLADRGDITLTAVTVLSNTLGAQKTLTILVNFTDEATQPYTLSYAQNMMFGTISNYDYENSYQQTTLAGDVAGWYTISESMTTCNYSAIASKAQQAATAAGFVLSNYKRYVYVFPGNACSWWGLGSVGGNPSQAWIHSKWGFNLTVTGHEMGHNFGLYHSHSLDCGVDVIASTGCTASEYGDIFDMMGGGSNTPHYNAYQKERLGWLNAGVSPPLTTVPTTTGTVGYAIAPMEDARNTVSRALKIPRGTACSATNEWFYVEARQAKGFDGFLSGNANVQGGVLVHKVTDGSIDSSYLLDMTPATSSWSDPALMAGLSFTDPLTGLVIAPVSVGGAGAQVNVTFPAASCTHAAPTVAVAPTGTVWTAAGSSTSYSVTVTNQDSCGCSSTTYDVGAAVPSGWSATNARTASIAPGKTTSSSVLVTNPSTTPPAYYPVTLNADNSSAPAMVASAASTIAVAAALTVATAADKATYSLIKKGNTSTYATITTNVTSSGSPVSGAAVTVDVTDPAGKVKTLTATTGGSGTAAVSYGMKSRTSPLGTYHVTSRGTMGSSTGTATTTFVVQ